MDKAPVVAAEVSVRPTFVRYGVVAFAVALAMVTYLDRVCISTIAKDIRRDLSLSEQQMGYVFSAFSLAYVVFEIPTAWWADRRGTRSVLTRIVLWWSTLTIATATSLGYGMMLGIRFLFGAGEAGAWPCVASTFSRWIPAKERGTVQGIFFAGAHLSGGLTPMLVIFLAGYMNWRAIFVLFGLVGFIWAIAWHLWYRDDPSEHPKVNAVELRTILLGRLPEAEQVARWEYWKRLLTHRNTWPLCLMYLGNAYAFYFCITWLPTYLEERHGVPRARLGFYAGLPLMFSVVGDFLGGITTDRLSKRFGLRVGRSALGAVGYTLAAGAMVVAATASHPGLAIVALSVGVSAVMFTLGATWGTCLDIGGRHTGVVSALMNTAGNAGSIFSPIIAIYAKNHLGGWNAPLFLIGGLFLVGAVCWCLIDPRDRVFD
jgi:MFS transporter, ACS family, glucarate transporter